MTVILTEHRLEEALPLALRAAVLERGRIIASGTPGEVGETLFAQGHGMFSGMPTPMRVWASVKSSLPCPVTVREGRKWLSEYLESHGAVPPPLPAATDFASDAPILTSDNVWFRYEKAGPDILKGLSLSLHPGEIFSLLGVNGAGKSTCLRILSGLDKPSRGEVSRSGKVALLPQNPKALFKKKTVRDDLLDAFSDFSGDKAFMLEKVNDFTHLCLLDSLLDRHPYDLSGGEQQRAALCKVLMCDPDILLLDEPTKGMDAKFKRSFAEILCSLKKRSKAVLLVSHDIEFCALCADTCGLLFDGALVTSGSPREFFCRKLVLHDGGKPHVPRYPTGVRHPAGPHCGMRRHGGGNYAEYPLFRSSAGLRCGYVPRKALEAPCLAQSSGLLCGRGRSYAVYCGNKGRGLYRT